MDLCVPCGTPGRGALPWSSASRSITSTSSAWSLRTRAVTKPAMLAPSTTARFLSTGVTFGGSGVLSSANA
ncbi:hypothetical protein QRX50_14180 [Amycolatopsis carbonis]|uniref:Uncharacterized protein n=1 Tax=Amycolatopsis carbonis TaxID=715471 RepID=A0A9Y2IKK3_9PSEU|nr:hypothetical protein [Amycolatopsis sp. 2-15]WIX81817.1 hypothetical protein QRX50_14180 [Amycolatopsis sp. 2-15]